MLRCFGLLLPLLSAAALFLALGATATEAKDYTVQTTADLDARTCDALQGDLCITRPGGECVTNPPPGSPPILVWPFNPFAGPCSLRAAVWVATPGDRIILPASTYVVDTANFSCPFQRNGQANQLGSIFGAGQATAIIDGAGCDGALLQLGGAATIADVTVRNSGGAGISNATATTLTLTSVTLSGNLRSGLFNQGTANLTNVLVTGNSHTSNGAGGIDNRGTLMGTNVTVTNNGGRTGGSAAGVGNSGNMTLANSTISGNTTTGGFAGGLYHEGASLTLNNVTISGNTAAANGGGGGASGATGGLLLRNVVSTVTLTNTNITNNQLTGAQLVNTAAGTSIQTNTGGTVSMTGGSVTGNSGGSIGGIAVVGSDAPTVTLSNVAVRNNTGGITGGGVYLQSSANLTINDSTLAGNSTTNSSNVGAGGVALNGAGQLTLARVTISGNTGRGVALQSGSNIPTTLTNVTISGNSSGGLRQNIFGGTSILTNVTIASNSGGPGLSTDSPTPLVLVKNTIVAGNTAGNCSGAVTSQGSNLSGDASCAAAFTQAGDQNNVNPLLGPLADNGGPTQTHALPAGSPAIDGVLSGCPPPSTDQRGATRPAGARCDVGAYEAGGAFCTPRPPVGVAVAPGTSGRLQVTITASATASALLQTLQFGSATNSVIDVPGGPQGATGNFTVNLAAGTQQTTFSLRKAAPAQAATAALVVVDSCGSWPTLVGGGPNAFPPEPPPPVPTTPPTPTAPPTPATVPAPTSGTPTAAAPVPVCAPRPAVAVTTRPAGEGRWQVTVTASASAHVTLAALRFGAATNARVESGGQSGPGGFAVTLPTGTQEARFTLTRSTAGQAATVPLTVVDSCGEWPTFVGGGASAPLSAGRPPPEQTSAGVGYVADPSPSAGGSASDSASPSAGNCSTMSTT